MSVLCLPLFSFTDDEIVVAIDLADLCDKVKGLFMQLCPSLGLSSSLHGAVPIQSNLVSSDETPSETTTNEKSLD